MRSMTGSSLMPVMIRRERPAGMAGLTIDSRRAPAISCRAGGARFYRCDEAASLPAHSAGRHRSAGLGRLDVRLPRPLDRAGLEPRAGAGHRHRAGHGQAHGEPSPARDGPRGPAGLRALSRGAEPGLLEQPSHGAAPAGDDPRQVSARRRGRAQHRRYDRAAMGSKDHGAWHLSRSGALVPRALRQGERAQMAVAHGGGSGAVDDAAVGLAVPDGAGAVRALEQAEWPAAQETDRLGAPGDPPGEAMAAGTA